MNFAHMYTSAKLAKQGLIIQNMILTARSCVLLHTRLRSLPSATSVAKFLLGRSLHPENRLISLNNTYNLHACSEVLL